MAAHFESHTLWSCSNGTVAGATHGATGELMDGFVYFRKPTGYARIDSMYARLSNGQVLQVTRSNVGENDDLKVEVLGKMPDGDLAVKVTTKTGKVGVVAIVTEGYYSTSPWDYDPMNLAEFSTWGRNGTVTSLAPGQEKALIDNMTVQTWFNEEITMDSEVVIFKPTKGDRIVTFSLNTKAITQDGAATEWLFRLKRTDGKIVAMAPTVVITSADKTEGRQVDLTTYVRGPNDPLSTEGVIPEVINPTESKIDFAETVLRVYSMTSPKVLMNYSFC